MIDFSCPSCQKLLRVADHLAEKQARCPECRQLRRVPAPTAPNPATVSFPTKGNSGPPQVDSLDSNQPSSLPKVEPVSVSDNSPVNPETVDHSSPLFSSSSEPLDDRPKVDHVPPSIPRQKVDRLREIPGYDILQLLGRGGMGIVYKAKQSGFNRLVAIKMVLGDYAGESHARILRTSGH